MKKFIVALLAVVMVVSSMSFAFAAQVDCYQMEQYKLEDYAGARSGLVVDNLEVGDIVTFYIKPTADGTIIDVEDTKLYVRGYANNTKAERVDAEGNNLYKSNGDLVLAYGVHFGDDNDALWSNEDGWYCISVKIKEAGANYFAVVTYDPGDEQTENNATGAQVGVEGNECYIAGITVKRGDAAPVTVDPADVKNFDTLENITPTKIEEPTEVSAEPTVDTTEDAPVEETGVVSIAVVAVAAVIGGAVVLKKREF